MNILPADHSRQLIKSRIGSYLERLHALGQHSEIPSLRRPWIVFLVGLAAICGTAAFIGVVPTKIYGHDVFVPLDIGWRVINGQRPHIDFVSAWGPVWFLVAALGLTISGHSANGIGYGNAIMALIVGSWSFLVSKNRLEPYPRVILSCFLAALVVAPYPLGESFYVSSHAMVYNRYGYALLGLILMECAASVRGSRNSHREEWIGGLSTGAALSLTLFLKASYFLVAVVVIGLISLPIGRVGYRRFLGMILACSLVSVCLLGYLRFGLAAMLGDLRTAGAARATMLSTRHVFQVAVNHASVLLGVVLFALATALLFGDRVPAWRSSRLLAVGILVFAADVVLMSTNSQLGGFPLCATFAIVIISEIAQDQHSLPTAEASFHRPLYVGALFLGVLLFLPQFTSDLAGLGHGAWAKEWPSPAPGLLAFTSPNLKPLLLYDGEESRSNGHVFTTYVNDGVALLERTSRADETVLSFDMTNPFPYALDRPPPRAGIVSPVYHLNIDDAHRPADDRFFGDADIVMVPKHPTLGDTTFSDFLRAYQRRTNPAILSCRGNQLVVDVQAQITS